MLVGPAGLWILLPKQQGGTITYSDGRYRQKGGNLYLKIFAQDSLGRPDLDVLTAEGEINKLIDEKLSNEYHKYVRSVLLFTNQKATIDITEIIKAAAERQALNSSEVVVMSDSTELITKAIQPN